MPIQRPRPRPTPFTQPFWDGLREERLLIQRCDDCGRWRWTPQLACPECLSEAFAWTPASGLGSVYSYTVIERPVDPRAFPEPYVLAVVRIDEGPHMLTNIVECAPEDVHVDMRVQVRFEALDDELSVYPFAPVGAGGAA